MAVEASNLAEIEAAGRRLKAATEEITNILSRPDVAKVSVASSDLMQLLDGYAYSTIQSETHSTKDWLASDSAILKKELATAMTAAADRLKVALQPAGR